MAVTNIDPAAITGVAKYEVYRVKWGTGTDAHFADAAIAILPSDGKVLASYADGTYLPTGTEVLQRFDTGDVRTGPGARVTITVPLSAFGATAPTVLKNVTGQALSYTWYAYYSGVPTPEVPGTVMDTAGPSDVSVLRDGSCKALPVS